MGIHSFGTKSRKRRACPRLSNTRNQASGTSYVRYDVTRKESLSSSIRYVESSRRDFVHLVRRRAKGELVLVCPIRGINHGGIRQSSTKSRERRACPRPFDTKLHETKACPRPLGTRIHAGWTSSVRYEVVRKESMSSSSWYKESSRQDHVPPVRSHTRRACPHPSGTRNQHGGTSSVRYKKSSTWDFIHPIRSRVKGQLVLFHPL